MITIKISGKENRIEHTVCVLLQEDYSLVTIDTNSFTLDSIQLFKELDEYNRNHTPDVSFLNRDFFKNFSGVTNNICIRNMLRAFACTDGYLSFHVADFRSQFCLENKLNTAQKYFFNKLLIDWTDKEEPQPQMFFVQQDLVNDELLDIKGLYDLQLLQKYSISFGKKTVNAMYVPFEYPDVNNLQIISKYSTWRKIVKGINEEVNRLVNNWRTT